MLGNKRVLDCKKFKTACENDILNRFPTIAQHISAINIDKNHISADVRGAGLYIQKDSQVCNKEALPKGAVPMEAIRVQVLPETKKFIDEQMDSLVQSGMKEAEAHEKVQAQLDSYESTLKDLDDQVDYARVNISLKEVEKDILMPL